MEKIIEQWLFENTANELLIFFGSMLPFGLYTTIPIAINIFHYPLWKALLFPVLGNTISCIPIYIVLKYLSDFLSRHSYRCKNYFERLFAVTRKKYSKRFEIFGTFTLLTLVMLPLPGAGARSGIITAFVFGISFLRSILLILFGIFLKGIGITLATLGIIEAFRFLN